MPAPLPAPRERTLDETLVRCLGRSFLPLVTLVLLAGTLVWGPAVTAGLAIVWWRVVGRLA